MFIKELYQTDQSSFDCYPRLANEVCHIEVLPVGWIVCNRQVAGQGLKLT
jgi:hypothetical protein